MKERWWHNTVVYQIYPRSFCDSNADGIGDIPGIISKLDYLQKLGINVIWLSPVYQSPMDDNGYDISDYQAIAPEFGTMQDIENLIAEAKKRNIQIIMDLVVNHSSDEHRWFIEARKSKSSKYRDYYVWRDPAPDGGVPNDLPSIFGGSAWELDQETNQYYLHLFTKKQPDLNWDNPNMHQEIYQMMNWWIDKGIGGFRMDVIDLIGKEIDKKITVNGKNLHPYLQEMHQATLKDKDLLTVGETWSATPEIAKEYSSESRKELSMIFQFEHITLTWGNGSKWNPIPLDLPKFKQILIKWQMEMADEGWNSLFWNNHDLPRCVSKYGDDKNYRCESAKMLASCLHFMRGTPYIYQGEEIGMTNVAFEKLEDYKDVETLNLYQENIEKGATHNDMMVAIHENGRDNARTPMHWDTTPHAGFTQGIPWIAVNPNYGQINTEQALQDSNSIFYHYQKLIQLRKENSVIVYGEFIPLLTEHDKIFAYLRKDGKQQILVVNNFSAQRIDLHLPQNLINMQGEALIANYELVDRTWPHYSLRPYESFAIKFDI